MSEKPWNFIELLPNVQSPFLNEILVGTSKNILQQRNWTFLVVYNLTWKLELVSNILWMIVQRGEIHRKTPVPKTLFSCEFCEIFKSIFFYRTIPVAASEENSFLFIDRDNIVTEDLWRDFLHLLKIVYKMTHEWYIAWQRPTIKGNMWRRVVKQMTASGATSDEWLRTTASKIAQKWVVDNDNEC